MVVAIRVIRLNEHLIPLLGSYLRESQHTREISTAVLTTLLFTTSKIRNQPGCLPRREWMKKKMYIYIMKFYSAVKENELMTFARKWM